MASKQGKRQAGAETQAPLRIRIVCKDGFVKNCTVEDAATGRPIQATRCEILPIDGSQGGFIKARLEVLVSELDLTADADPVQAEIGQLKRHIAKIEERIAAARSRAHGASQQLLEMATRRVADLILTTGKSFADCHAQAAKESPTPDFPTMMQIRRAMVWFNVLPTSTQGQ
jgi:hypothetical protein